MSNSRHPLLQWIDDHIIVYRYVTNTCIFAATVVALFKIRSRLRAAPLFRYKRNEDIPAATLQAGLTVRGKIAGIDAATNLCTFFHAPLLLPARHDGTLCVRMFGLKLRPSSQQTLQSVIGRTCKVEIYPSQVASLPLLGNVYVKERIKFTDIAKKMLRAETADVDPTQLAGVDASSAHARRMVRRYEALLDARPRKIMANWRARLFGTSKS